MSADVSQVAVLYMRKSVDDPDSFSFSFQEADCRKYASEHDYKVVAALSEPHMSGHDSLDERGVLKRYAR